MEIKALNIESPQKNTDVELFRETEDDYYSDSLFKTEQGAIGIDCGGSVIVAPVRKWFDAMQSWNKRESGWVSVSDKTPEVGECVIGIRRYSNVPKVIKWIEQDALIIVYWKHIGKLPKPPEDKS